MSEQIAQKHEGLARDKEVDDVQGACRHALKAAEIWLNLLKAGPRPAEKARFRTALRRSRLLATRLADELRILKAASALHGCVFELSPDPPPSAAFLSSADNGNYEDPTEFSLSDRQKAILRGWKRPRELFPYVEANRVDLFMLPAGDPDLVQDVTTDCSVVASLCAIIKASEKRKTSILGEIMHPYDHAADKPLLSPSGKYVFRFHFNGCRREVVIDDRLPASSTPHRSIFVKDRQNCHLLWPALVEKAYLKVRGGYDFPGSNSGTDLAVLTGWVPEQVHLRSEDLDLDKLWHRMLLAYDKGLVMITLGTGVMSREEEDSTGLGGEHDYVVLALQSARGERRLLVKNPWAPGTVWKGFCVDTGVGGGNMSDLGHSESGSTLAPGTFWMSLQHISQNFLYLYLNWSPEILQKAQSRHFEWSLDNARNTTTHAHNPQFCISTATGGNVWVLLRKHFLDGELQIARSRSHESSLTETSQRLGFICLRVFVSNGKRVDVYDTPIHKSLWLDSSHTLARFNAQANTQYTLVAAQDLLPLDRYTFSLTMYSPPDLAIEDPQEKMAVNKFIRGSWAAGSAGGNSHSASYFLNPQYSISVPSKTPVNSVLECENPDFCVRVDIAWTGGRRAIILNTRDLLGNSGDYRKGSAALELPSVEAGRYTVVCSTFEAGQMARFTLKVGAMLDFAIEPIPPEHVGRKVVRTPELLFQPGERRKRAPIRLTRMTRAFVLASHLGAPSRSGLRASLIAGQGPDAQTLTISGDGEFAWSASGVRTPDRSLDPRDFDTDCLWLCIEVMGLHNSPQHLFVQVLSEMDLEIGTWELADDY